MRTPVVVLALSLFSQAAAGQQADRHATVVVGTASAPRGQVARGALKVPAGPDSASAIAVAVINGAKPGPVVAFIAGSHGTEYTSIVALTRLISRIEPRLLSGTVIVAPLLNVASFTQMTVHNNPVDGKGMNSLYPGDLAGTQTQRVLALVADRIVSQADVIVDLHGGDLDEDLRPYSYWTRTGQPGQDTVSHRLALAFGLDHIIVRDVDLADPASRRSLGGYALSLNKTALVAEAGRSGTVVSDDVDLLVAGSLNVLRALKMLEGTVHPIEHPVWLDAGARVAADSAGMFFQTVTRGTYVAEGEPVGYTTDYLGRRIADIRSPATGVVTFIRGVPSMWKGATLVNVGRVLLPEPPAYQKPGR